ncbi:MAG: hypothetical protein HQ546_00685, partial [Planctomycetes bacterium]|nr:hypothetical protein [Planctomycetota bacterium]
TKLAGGELSDDKMSKSLGNIRTISKLLNRYSGETIRTFVLSTHYRRPLDFSDQQLVNTERALKNFYRLFERIQRITGQNVYDSGEQLHQLYAQTADQKQRALVSEVLDLRVQMQQSMEDDFNTAGAIATLHDLVGVINRYIDANHLEACASEMDEQLLASVGRSLVANARILGLFQTPPAAQGGGELEAKLIEMLISLREQVRSEKNYALADRIRDELSAIGITLEDGGGGTAWRKE